MSGKTAMLKNDFQSARALICALQAVMAPLSFALFITGMVCADFNVMLSGVVVIFLSNVIYGCLDLRSRLLFLFLHGGIALFLLSRPVIGALNPSRTWLLSTAETTAFALTALYVSMLFLFLGTVFCGALTSWNEREGARRKALAPKGFDKPESERVAARGGVLFRSESVARFVSEAQRKLSQVDKLHHIRRASFVIFLVCVLSSYYEGAIKLAYMEGLSYEDYYLISSDDYVPWVVSVFSSMALYAMCAYLATMPKKLPTTICLGLYVLSTVPVLIIGSRSNFVIAFLFAALYFILRSITDREEKWITREIVITAAIVVPVGLFFMGMWTYIRADQAANLTGIFAVFEDALYKQGVSFTVLGRGYDADPQIQNLGFKFFTAGAIISNITEGFIGTTFFGVEPLGSTNSIRLALEGNSYSHTMSFFTHYNYLGGEGYGSSYLLEWYADFGYGGIVVGSLILAGGLYLLSRSIGRSWFWGTAALVSSLAVFHMPRGAAAEWISFLTSTRFWMAIGAVVVGAIVFLFVSYLARKPKLIEVELTDGSGNQAGSVSGKCLLGGSNEESGLRVLTGNLQIREMAKRNSAALNRHGISVFWKTGNEMNETR